VQAQSIFKGLNVDNSAFLLGATNARKSQCLYKPSDFNTLPFNGKLLKYTIVMVLLPLLQPII